MRWVLQSTRLHFRPCTNRDVTRLLKHWTEPMVRRFLFDDHIANREQVEQFVANSSVAFRKHGYGLWVLTDKASGQFRGVCGLCESALVQIDLLFSITPSAWGQGLATESAGRVLQYAFDTLGLPCVMASVDKPNHRSIKVLEKLEMFLQQERTNNSNPVLCYGITLEDRRSRIASRSSTGRVVSESCGGVR